MSDNLHDALNRLARRGKPRGFDAVFAGAADSAERDAAAIRPVERGSDTGDLDTIPFVTTEPLKRRRRPLGSMIAAAGIASLVVVGTFAVSAVVGNGGSSSAEGAVRRLADALSHEDPLAAADVLAPSEVRSLHGTVDAAAQKAKELQLVQNAGAPLAGVDFNVDGLKLSTQSLGDGFAKVTVDEGVFTASTYKAQFSALMQRVLRASGDNSAHADLAKLAESQNLPTFVVAIREHGHWYVSAAYTVLEYVRESQHLPGADFGSGVHIVSTLGADSPDAAVQDSMRALQSEDWTKLMSMVNPSEIPFYDYRAAFNELIRRSRADATTPASSGFTIGSMKTTSQVSGDTARVTLNASGTTKHGTWSLDGGCFTATNDQSAGIQLPYPVTCSGVASRLYFSLLAFPFTAVDANSAFTVVQRDGRWFVSPVGTVLDVLDRTISQLDQRSVYALLNVPERIPVDGALTLGKPVVLTTSKPTRGMQVLSFDGHQGEQLLGLATSNATKSKSTVSDYQELPANVRIFAPDGSELTGDGGVLTGHPLTLPADATYKVVLTMQIWAFDTTEATVTIWNAANAPADAKKDRGYQTCDYTVFGSSCMSASGSSGSGGPTPTFSVPNGETCTSTATESLCSVSSPSMTSAPNGSTPRTVASPTTAIGGSINVSETTSAPHG